MQRRDFIAALGAGAAGAFAGCINQTPQYGLDDPVTVREGTIRLTGVRTTRTLLTQPSDTPPSIVGGEGNNYLVFIFDTTDLAVESRRAFDYITDFIQYRLSPDTVAPPVSTPPRQEASQEGVTSVAYDVGTVFDPDGTSLRWLGDNAAQWPASTIIDEQTRAALENPPSFTVDNVAVPDTTTLPTVDITLTVTNTGETAGPFNAIVRADTAAYITETIQPDETRELTVTVELDGTGENFVVINWGTGQQTRTTTAQE